MSVKITKKTTARDKHIATDGFSRRLDPRGWNWKQVVSIAGVMLADYIMVMLTMMVLLPIVGGVVGKEAHIGSRPDLSGFDVLLAAWFLPMLFLTLLLAAGEFCLMRTMWRWARRH